MPQQKKDMMASLLKSHANKALQIDDVIKGKGKGLVFLLHGPPGVGKTLTAESVADCYQRPLCVLGAGDLGGFGARVEKKLDQAMRLAVRWDAALLIDEADIFMEERKENEILHNELVLVLLRCVEYYQGVMFLTTNRMGSIDPAFKPRIHLALSLPPLCIDDRKRLWERFLVNATGGRPKFLTAKYMDKIARENINCREIKNIVRLSFALATSANRQLRSNDVDESLQSLKSFEKDFEDAQNDKKRTAEFESQRNPKRVKKQFFGLV
ncbi:P-loop containing nucleoside triphosphate hydrolase protein [Boeremia exigua]|uniref:P-loop containing nucleoside triphosphate hydrolase protein n=1 Tax=Boeremia exigua TaxID=749465 RepID=UPI001E8D004B|nr:P-loop containing nucleoside triphosphate hydrolase protein [Boeremia exigua]KAH6643549.1 P-loop containing nucleoside triphosphate hydrolase protein [Boeremia exigua]